MVMQSDYFTEEEVEKIFKGINTDQHRLFLKALYYTGARISEITGLDTEELPDPLTPLMINFDRRIMRIRNLKSKSVKRNCTKCGTLLKTSQKVCFCGSSEITETKLPKRWKTVIIPPEFAAELKAHITATNIGDSQPIFPFSRFVGYRIVRRTCEKAGLKSLGKGHPHPHAFRHTFVMHGIKNKVDTKLIQTQTGHSSVATLGEYFGLTEDATQQIDRMFKKKVPQETNQGRGVS